MRVLVDNEAGSTTMGRVPPVPRGLVRAYWDPTFDMAKGADTMKLDELLAGTHDALSVRRVFGDEYEKDGVTFIPAASIRGGGGGGGGGRETNGGGTGFGMSAHPVGAYRIRGDEIDWIPAADTTREIVLAEVLAVVALLVFKSVRKACHRRG